MQFMGFDGFIWFTGVVEDRRDPMKLGRMKVRIAGLHTEAKTQATETGIPTADLPWAHPMQPITSGAMNGIGTTPLGPVEGTWVVGFFRDGENCQEPIVMGTIGGYPMEGPKSVGFNDPNKVYPKETHLIEPDTHRRARASFKEPENGGEFTSKPTPLDTEGGRVEDKAVYKALADTWDEPENPFKAEYPFNHVRATESGHVEEFDDTLDHERMMRWHKTGTFEEIRETGTKVTKVQKDNYQIVLGDEYVHIKPNPVDGAGGNMYVTVDGDCHLAIGGDYKTHVKGNATTQIDGNWSVTIGGNTEIQTGGTKLDQSGGVHTIKGSVIHLNP
jgi:hypothetical protein